MKILILLSILGATWSLTIKSTDLHKIIKHVNQIKTTWTAGNNFESTDKIRESLFGILHSDLDDVPIRRKHKLPDSALPKSFDAREHWSQCPSIRDIRDQGNCNSCWAVAGASTLTDRLCIATNGSFSLPLSSNQVTACSFPFGGLGCEGGTEAAAWKFFKAHGLVTGGEYGSTIGCQPYEITPCDHHLTNGSMPSCDASPTLETPSCHQKCINPSYEKSFQKDHHKIKKAYRLLNDIKEIQKDILLHGPLVTGFDVHEDFLTYKSGVYQHVIGKKVGRHGVRVIGWGIENGTPYWLIANSWNKHWGDNGTVKYIRGANDCGIDQSFIGGVPIINS